MLASLFSYTAWLVSVSGSYTEYEPFRYAILNVSNLKDYADAFSFDEIHRPVSVIQVLICPQYNTPFLCFILW